MLFDSPMFRKLSLLFLAFSSLSANATGYSEYVLCPQELENEAGYLQDWNSVYASYGQFWRCDDGAVAEGYSKSVISLLVGQWHEINALENITTRDEAFEKFILRHIDELASCHDLLLIWNNAHKACPKGSRKICKAIINDMKKGGFIDRCFEAR